ncbi:OmpH family outer membrane protein [bacterium]|nr:OmpH family outer membrane protein [bacterium]
MTRLISVLMSLVVAAALAASPALADAELSAGNIKACFIDLQEVLENFPEYTKAKESLQGWAEPKQKMISEKEKNLQRMDNELKKSVLLTQEAREGKEKDFKKELEGYQSMVKDLQSDLADKERELLAPVKENLAKSIEAVSKDLGYNVVFDAAAPAGRPILYVDDSLDITQAVVEKLKKEGKGKEGKEKPGKEKEDK